MSRTHARRLAVAVALAALSLPLAARPAPAQARVTIAPTTLSVARRDASGIVTLTNVGGEVADFQATVHAWSATDTGAIVLGQTTDLLVAPSVFRLGPGESRRVRVLSRVSASALEGTYRLVLAQLPDPTGGRSGVEMRMQLSVPVFVPAAQATVALDAIEPTASNDDLVVRLHNRGNTSLLPQRARVRILDGEGTEVTTATADLWYLLAGDAREVRVPIAPDVCARGRAVEVVVVAAGRPAVARTTMRTRDRACAP